MKRSWDPHDEMEKLRDRRTKRGDGKPVARPAATSDEDANGHRLWLEPPGVPAGQLRLDLEDGLLSIALPKGQERPRRYPPPYPPEGRAGGVPGQASMRERDGDRSARPRLTVARALGTMGDERITLAGEFDVYTGRAAAEELQPHDPRTRILELDLTRVTFIDATGIQAMVRALRRAWQLDYELRITGVSPAVARLLRLVGLRQLLPDALEAGGPRRRSAPLGSGESSEVVALDRQRNTGPGLPTQHL